MNLADNRVPIGADPDPTPNDFLVLQQNIAVIRVGVPLRCLFTMGISADMTDRPASWRMPTPKKMEKLAAEAARRPALLAPDAPLPAEYWESVLKDPRAQANGAQMGQRRLAEIQRHVLRVSCRRCERVVEIQTIDAVRLYGGNAVWKDVAQRLLDSTCILASVAAFARAGSLDQCRWCNCAKLRRARRAATTNSRIRYETSGEANVRSRF